MATIGIFQSVSLDGVYQAPGRADEDTRGGFVHGGWGDGYQDEVSMGWAAEGMGRQGALLFGHRTYTDLMEYWTTVGDDNPFTGVLVDRTKYVVSRSADTDLPYPNSELLPGEAVETVAGLRGRVEGELTIMGSGELVRALHAAGLIDRYTLQVFPIVLGSGRRLFAEADRVELRLLRSMPTTTGVLIAEYEPRR